MKRLAQPSEGDGSFPDRHLAQERRRPTLSQTPFFLISARLIFVCFFFLAAPRDIRISVHPLQWELGVLTPGPTGTSRQSALMLIQ